ncbi:MAG: hypothetical protein LJE93_02775 [Acidobacteria bacterium]|jgi:hypothetical protein|nr:hypothetical protein [Acidobacteriota bacterium]
MEGQREGENRRHRQWVVVGLLAITIGIAHTGKAQVTSRSARRRVVSGGNPITLAVTTDRPAYSTGDTIHVTAVAQYGDGSAVESVKRTRIEIKDGAGWRVARGSLENQSSGTFTYAYATSTNATVGSWQVEVEIEDTERNKKAEEVVVQVTAGTVPCGDADGDGYNDASCGGTDCNDSDPSIHPGAEEICGDGIDQDCSGADLECPPPCGDADGDGYNDASCGGNDCNDSDPSIHPGAEDICGDGIDQDCSGADLDCGPPCGDADGDGYEDAACGGTDCNDSDPLIHPGAAETCGDGVDQDCSGADLSCDEPHAGLSWAGPETCLQCHQSEALQVHGSVMYQWKGETPDMVNGGPPQGKIAGGVNSYCINILGNWNVCGNCHIGLGAEPNDEATPEELANIDCMICHQQAYRRKKVDGTFVPDTDNMAISMDEAARTVHRPVRSTCLQCHAKAGGGDAVKRGDLTLAQGSTTDFEFDVHMATTGANLECQACHTFTEHRVAGKGSDLRPTDSAAILECANCHADMASGEHEGESIDRHTDRVACQTCHIPTYAKDASDSEATEATEVHRTWLGTHSTSAPFHPIMDKANDLVPEYRFWNRLSDNYLLGDVATVDSHTGRYPTSRPLGDVADADAKLYAFKYKTALQPITNDTSQLIALDTSVFFATSDADAATRQGLANMGLSTETAYSWVETDTYQMLNHQVSPSGQALQCNDCHGSTSRMDLQGELGYGLKASTSVLCVQCHERKSSEGFTKTHEKHVKDKRYDCSWCHQFSRPERGLRMP